MADRSRKDSSPANEKYRNPSENTRRIILPAPPVMVLRTTHSLSISDPHVNYFDRLILLSDSHSDYRESNIRLIICICICISKESVTDTNYDVVQWNRTHYSQSYISSEHSSRENSRIANDLWSFSEESEPVPVDASIRRPICPANTKNIDATVSRITRPVAHRSSYLHSHGHRHENVHCAQSVSRSVQAALCKISEYVGVSLPTGVYPVQDVCQDELYSARGVYECLRHKRMEWIFGNGLWQPCEPWFQSYEPVLVSRADLAVCIDSRISRRQRGTAPLQYFC